MKPAGSSVGPLQVLTSAGSSGRLIGALADGPEAAHAVSRNAETVGARIRVSLCFDPFECIFKPFLFLANTGDLCVEAQLGFSNCALVGLTLLLHLLFVVVSIRAPARGATCVMLMVLGSVQMVSIRAPARGATIESFRRGEWS